MQLTGQIERVNVDETGQVEIAFRSERNDRVVCIIPAERAVESLYPLLLASARVSEKPATGERTMVQVKTLGFEQVQVPGTGLVACLDLGLDDRSVLRIMFPQQALKPFAEKLQNLDRAMTQSNP